MNHPEGRVLAIQQQMFFAQILADKMGMETENVLRKLALSGLTLAADSQEHTVDAAAIYPKLAPERANLSVVRGES